MGAKKKRCCVPGCTVFAVSGDGKTVFHLPSNPERRREWMRRLGNRKLLTEKLSTIKSTRFVCPSHFEDVMFRDRHHDHLHSFAAPTIFPDGHNFLTDSEMAGWDVENGTLCFRSTVDQKKPNEVFQFKSKKLISILKPRSPGSSSMQKSPVVVSPTVPSFQRTDYGFLIDCVETESIPVPGSSKRKRSIGSDDEEEIYQAEKCLRRDSLTVTEEPSSHLPRRSMESSGARVRSPKRVSIHHIASMAGVKPLSTPNEFKLAKKAQELRQMAHQFRRKQVSRRTNSSLKKLASARFVDMVDELQISPVTRQIVKAEMKNFKRKEKGRVWTPNDKLFALAIYKRSTRAYRFMRQYIILPSENTLKTLLMKVPLEPGISQTLLSLLSTKVKRMVHWEKSCIVSFDETFLRGNLFFNPSKNVVEGYENYGHRGRTNRVADHALVFMVQGISTKWTFPVAYFLVSKTCPSTMLKILLTDVIKALFSICLNVFGSVSDQGPTNVGAINELKKESGGDSIFYTIDDHKLVHIWDMPHNLKNVRNNLLSSNLEFSDGHVAKWRHLVYFFKCDESLFETSNLTYKHLNPQGRDKMKVSLAAQTLSASVSKAIKTFQALINSPELEECLAFALLCDQVDLFFDLCNGPRAGEKEKETRTNVTPSSLHHEMWAQVSDSLKKWTFIRNSDGQRHVPPCVHGWIQNIQSFQALWKKVENCGLNILKLRDFNQDPVENLFCLVRQCAGSASDLTTRTFTAALKTTLVTRFSSPVRDKNCLDDESFFISDLRPLVISQEPTESPPVTDECLIRGDTPQKIHHYRASDPLERQGPTKLLALIMPTILQKIKCDQCLSLICTQEKRQDTLLITNSSLELFTSVALVSLFMNALSLFNQKWMRLLYKKCIKSEVVAECIPSNWARLFCPAHIESDYKNSLLEEVSVTLIKSKIKEVNQKFKEKVVRRSRQVMACDMKNSDGLRVSEEDAEMHPSDLQLLLGPGDSAVPPESSTPQRGSTAAGSSTPLRVSTAAGSSTSQRGLTGMTPMRTPVRGKLPPPPIQTPIFVTPARQKVMANWQPPPTPSTPQSKTTLSTFTLAQMKDFAQSKKLGSLTIPQLKQFFKEQNKRVGGNKPELIRRIETEVFNL